MEQVFKKINDFFKIMRKTLKKTFFEKFCLEKSSLHSLYKKQKENIVIT